MIMSLWKLPQKIPDHSGLSLLEKINFAKPF